MNISELSIRRPVLASVLTIIILLFGLIGYSYLGVREFPSVDNPIISVSCSYPGANADVIENQITEPLEQNINGIPGIRSLSSVSSQGQSRITVEFELSVDLETAANDVRDKVSRAQRYLPRDCDPPTVTKADADASPILMVTIQSDKRSLLELSEIADLTAKEQLQTISDVSGVQIWGEKRYSMRLWLDPAKMAGYGITPTDIKTALDRENVELPSGSIEGNTTELTIRTMGLMHTTREFNDLVVREDADRIIRMSDVGRAELGPQDTRSYMKMNGIPMVGVVVIPQPGANHIEIADAVYARMESMKKDLPDDVVTSYGFDNTRFIRASIDEVRTTVYEAFILVIIIIFLFLRNWRVTLIPCIVIPVSLIGTFFVMYVAGFSINVLSMLAVVLSVGLVVDDAIVMTENIYIRIERGMTPFDAGIEGAKEIFFAVISTSITLIAVFFPIVFMEGMTGRLFREFSMVISGAVVISTFAALTITPMLATKLLVRQEKKSWFYSKTEPFFVWLNDLYSRTLASFLRRRWLALPLVLLTMGLIGWLWSAIPAEMAPLEDRSQISINTRGSEGATYEYIRDYTEDINRLVDSLVPEASSVTARVSSGSGNVRIALTDIATRKRSQMEIAEQISAAVRSKTKARAFVQQQSTFGGRRGRMPVQYVLQATSLERLQEVLPEFMRKVYESPVFQMADVDLKFSKPEVRIEVNRDKANLLGVSTRNIAQTLQYGLSGQRLGYFYMNGKQYEILAEINRQQRNKPADLRSIYVRSDKGEMIQMDNLISLAERRAAAALPLQPLPVGHRVGRTGQGQDHRAGTRRNGPHRRRDARRRLPHGAGRRLEGVPRKLVEPDVRLHPGRHADLPDPRRAVRELQGPAGDHAHRAAGHRRRAGLHVGRGPDDEHLQPDRHHHADRTGGQERHSDRRVRQPETGGRAGQDASHRGGLAATPAPDPDDLGLDHPGPAAADRRHGGRRQRTYRHGYRRGGRHGGLDAADALHRSGHLQLRIDEPNQEIETQRRMKIAFLAALLLGIGSAAGAQEAPPAREASAPLTLRKCLEIGLEQNYDVRIVRNEERVSDNNATAGNAGMLPTVDLSAGYTGTLDNDRTVTPRNGDATTETGVYDQTANVGLAVNWTLFDGLRIRTNYKRLKEMQQMGALKTRITIEDFMASLTAEYYNYIQQTLRLENFRYAVSLSRERLRITEARVQVGNFSRLDLLQARVDFNADSSKYMSQHELVTASRIRINELLANENLDERFSIPDSVIRVNATLDWNDLLAKTLSANASLLMAEHNSSLAELDLKTVLARNYPYVNLTTGYGYTYNRYGTGGNLSRGTLGLNAGVKVGFTIFDGNRRREQRNARIGVENAQLTQQRLEQSLRADLSNFWQAYRNNLEVILLEEENLIAAKENYEIAMERYLLGDLPGIEMREAQKSLLDAEERILTAQYNTKLCEISLQQISGNVMVYLE